MVGGGYRHGGFDAGMTHGDPDAGGRHGDVGLTIGRADDGPGPRLHRRSPRDGQPFFVWYAPMMPHSAAHPPARLLDKYRSQAPTLEFARYWAMIEWFDETCGQLLDHLDVKGLTDDTMVVYLADNGWIQVPPPTAMLRVEAVTLRRRPAHADHRPLAGEGPAEDVGSARALPRHCTHGPRRRRREAPARTAGRRPPGRCRRRCRKAIFGEIFTHNAIDIHRPASSLRYRWALAGDWKLILPDPRNTPGEPAELYDVTSDPFETRNLADGEVPRVAHLKSLIDAWWPATD